MRAVRLRFGLLPKMIVFLTAVLLPLAAITWYVSVRTLRQEMTEEFTSKGTAIANSLAQILHLGTRAIELARNLVLDSAQPFQFTRQRAFRCRRFLGFAPD